MTDKEIELTAEVKRLKEQLRIDVVRLSAFDHCESVAEELKMNGFNVRVIKGDNDNG
jgi:ATP-dependent RNA circularization protein (DNA/RNA ligase family)